MGVGRGTPSNYLLQKGLTDAGHQIHFVVPRSEENKVSRLPGITFHYFSTPLASFGQQSGLLSRLVTKANWGFFVLAGWAKAKAVAESVKPDLVIGHASYGIPVAYLVARKMGIPNVSRLYGTFLYPHLSSFWQRFKKIEEVVAFKIPSNLMIITNDGTKGDEVARYFKVPKDRIRFWMNGVNKEIFDPNFDAADFKQRMGLSPNVALILSVSRLERWKGVHRLISAVPAVVGKRQDVVCVIVGDGSEKAALVQLAEKLGVLSFVKFTGAITAAEVAKYMNAADIVATLQDYSNVGNPLLEAMICGKCILTLSTGNTARLIKSGETGILLSLKDLEQLPKRIVDLLDDNALRNELGQNARHYALDNFQSWDERIKTEIAELEELGSARRRIS